MSNISYIKLCSHDSSSSLAKPDVVSHFGRLLTCKKRPRLSPSFDLLLEIKYLEREKYICKELERLCMKYRKEGITKIHDLILGC